MCAAVCPKYAISIKLNDEGFYRPIVDEALCVDCSLCTQVCYKFDESIIGTSNEELLDIPLYAASATDDELVANTTSGGIADLLAKELIRQGYRVIGVVYDYESDRAVSKVAITESETDAFRGSKYIQSYTLDAFRTIVGNCKKEKFAVFGLPCHIYAVNRYLKKYDLRNNCILIDLYCHGCPSMLVWNKVNASIKKKLKVKQLSFVNFRSKEKGWGQFVLEAKSDKKRYISTPMHNEFFDLFFSNQVLNESCTDCQLRSTLAYTDIRLGDFWGKLFRRTSRGMSGISIVTKNGAKLLDRIVNLISIQKISPDYFIPYQSWGRKYIINSSLRKTVIDYLLDEDKSINDVAKIKIQRQGFVAYIKRIVKQVLHIIKLTY